jgi:methanol corrinoid protein
MSGQSKFIADLIIDQYRKNPQETIRLIVDAYQQEKKRIQELTKLPEPSEEDEVIKDLMPPAEPMRSIADATRKGEIDQCVNLVESALTSKIPPQEIVMKGLLPGVQAAAALYDARCYFAPDLLMAGKALKEATAAALKGLKEITRKGTILMHAPEGDVHDIGKNIVKIVLEANFYDCIDVGVDIGPEKLLSAVKKHNPMLVTGHALMTTTMPGLMDAAKRLKESGYQIPFAMGGAPVTQKYVEKIDLGIYGRSPVDAVKIANLAAEKKSWEQIRKAVHK